MEYKPGRPRKPFCKRGHFREKGTQCIPCRRLRERLKYRRNTDFREAKKAYQRQWRADFLFANGYHYSTPH